MNLDVVAWDTLPEIPRGQYNQLKSGPTLRSATIVRTFSFAWTVNLFGTKLFWERKRLFVKLLRFLTLNLTNLLINFTAKNVYWSFSLRFVRMTFGSWRVRKRQPAYMKHTNSYRHWIISLTAPKVGLLNCALRRDSTFCVLRRLVIHVMSTDCFLSDRAPFFIPLQIPETEGASLAASHSVGFCEVSVADNSPNLYKIFEKLLIESRARPVKPRKFSVSKMIGKSCTLRPNEPDF